MCVEIGVKNCATSPGELFGSFLTGRLSEVAAELQIEQIAE